MLYYLGIQDYRIFTDYNFLILCYITYLLFNNMSSTLSSVLVYINSKDRTYGTNEEFTTVFESPITGVTQGEIISIEIPYTFYTVNHTNNVLVVNLNNDLNDYVVTIPSGSYGISMFTQVLQGLLENDVDPDFLVLYNRQTFKITITNANRAFRFKGEGTTMADLVGLIIGENFPADGSTVNTALMPKTINLAGTKYVFIKSVRLVRPNVYRPYSNSERDDILYKLSVTGNPGEVMVDKVNLPDLFKYGVRQSIGEMDFKLVDEYGDVLDLNNQPWSLTVKLTVY
jgi:hypothetical protein